METKIDDILASYEITAPERTVCKQACEVINELFNTDLSADDVRYKQGTLWVDTTPMVRSQIHLKKEVIKKEVSSRLKNRQISDLH